MEAKRIRNAKLVVGRSALHPHRRRGRRLRADPAGTDIAFSNGIIRYALTTGRFHEEYVRLYTNAPYIISEKFGFRRRAVQPAGTRPTGSTTRPPGRTRRIRRPRRTRSIRTMQDPRCVFQLIKKHVDRYTPEMVEKICGTPKASSSRPPRSSPPPATPQGAGTIMYALGWTQHSSRADDPRRGDDAAAARQHRQAGRRRQRAPRPLQHPGRHRQRLAPSRTCPATSATPRSRATDLKTYLEKVRPDHAEPPGVGEHELLAELPEVHGLAAEGDLRQERPRRTSSATTWLPRAAGNYSWMYIFDHMYNGKPGAGGTEPGPEGLINFGMNPVDNGPNSRKVISALSKLKWLVVARTTRPRPLPSGRRRRRSRTRAAGRRRSRPRSSCCPAPDFAEKDGTLHQLRPLVPVEVQGDGSAGRRQDRPGDHRPHLPRGSRPLQEGGRRASPSRSSTSTGATPTRSSPTSAKCAKEINGKALDRRQGPEGPGEGDPQGRASSWQVLRAPRRRQHDVRQLAALGCYTEAGNNDAAAQQRRPERPRHVPQLGLLLARQPPRHVQPLLGGRRRQAVGSRRGRASSGTARSGSATFPT